MSRLLLAAGLALAAGLSGTPAQDKKDPPKKKERIALADPKDAAKDPDFAVQGEYTGTVTLNSGDRKVGAQVVAKGLGEFEVKVLMGGLPGDGWDGKTVLKATAKRGADGAVALTGKDLSGTVAGGKLTLKDGGKIDTTLAKVERKSDTLGKQPPAGAVVLFGKEGDEKNWNGGKLRELSDGKFLDIGVKSKEKFGAFTAHVEFRLPWMPNSTGQGRGNSGVYLQDRYECQVLDSFGLSGENNECGGIYQQYRPAVNMCFPPLAWQTYDIEFTPAAFDGDKKVKPARATIRHNGVVIHDNIEFKGPTGGGQKEEATPGPLQFQNHGDPVVFRNIWVAEKK
jgi:hypothetical protein